MGIYEESDGQSGQCPYYPSFDIEQAIRDNHRDIMALQDQINDMTANLPSDVISFLRQSISLWLVLGMRSVDDNRTDHLADILGNLGIDNLLRWEKELSVLTLKYLNTDLS